MMVDSDDVIHPEFVIRLLGIMQRHDADIAVGGYVPFYGTMPVFPSLADGDGNLRHYDQREAMLTVFYQHGLTHSPWGRIFKASLFDGIRFPLGIIYEDLAIIYPLLKKTVNIVTTSQVLYGYRQHENNSMRVFSSRRADVLDVCEQLESEIATRDKQYLKAVRSRLLSAYFNILLLSSQDKATNHDDLRDRCWKGIKRLRGQCLIDPNVRIKNKMGIIASYLGRDILCKIIGRNYQPKP